MAKIVFAWELGSGLGHLVRLRCVAERIVDGGHAIVLIAKDVKNAELLFGDLNIKILPAPIPKKNFRRIRQSFTFAHVLHNSGFGSVDALAEQVKVWRQYLRAIEAQVLVCEHSPSALLAARGLPLRTVLIGTGFTCPAVSTPFENLRPQQAVRSDRLLAHEEFLVKNANKLLQHWRAPPLECLAQLYREVDQLFLTTFAELDPYPNRGPAEYWGAWSYAGGDAAEWPTGEGPKCFAYLKPFPALPALLTEISNRPISLLVVGSAKLADGCSSHSASIKFTHRPVDMQDACREGELAILNGTHGATAAALLAGIPILQLPIFLEQGLTAQRVEALGAGRVVGLQNADPIVQCLDELLANSKYREAAQAFAARYADYRPERKLDELVTRLLQ